MTPIYLDYNATTPIAPEVSIAMQPYLEHMFGNPSSSNALGQAAKAAIQQAREQVAHLLNGDPSEVTFTSGGTESNNHALKGVAAALKHKGRHIITSAVEHPAVIEVCRHLEKQGYEVTYLTVDKWGTVKVKNVASAIRPDTILISIMHANNETGTLQPLAEIAQLAKKHGILVHTDASQSIGKVPTNAKQLGVDLLTIAGHKLYAPKGIGALYIKSGTPIENLLHGAGQESGRRPGTENVMHIVGLGKACDLAASKLAGQQRHLLELRNLLLEELQKQVKCEMIIHTPLKNSLPNTLSVAFKGIPAHELAAMVSSKVSIATGSACHSGTTTISSVLKAMGIDEATGRSTVRLSVGKYSTKDEVRKAALEIANGIESLSKGIK